MEEVKRIILSNDEISVENAIRVNQELQNQLVRIINKVKNQLTAVQDRYRENERLLKKTGVQKVQVPNKLTSVHFCGAPFFKTRDYHAAPNNPDFEYRKNKLKEFFPMELKAEVKSPWTNGDSCALLQGVKEQYIAHLLSKCRDKLRSLKSKPSSSKLSTQINEHMNKIENKTNLADLHKLILDLSDQFKINWYLISTGIIQHRHTPSACEAFWNGFLRPDICKDPWTNNEEDKLLDVVEKYDFQNWEAIAKELPGRSAYQCFVQYQSKFKFNKKNSKWSEAEDELLSKAIDKFRIGSIIPWTKVTEQIPNRTKMQVYNRYMFSIKNGIRKGKFTEEEDCILLAVLEQYDYNFDKIPISLFPGRTLPQIRGRYKNVLQYAKTRIKWDSHYNRLLMDLVEKYGPKNWSEIAKEFKGMPRQALRNRYLTIKTYLEKNPKSTVEDVPAREIKSKEYVNFENWSEKFSEIQSKSIKNESSSEKIYKLKGIALEFFDTLKYTYKLQLNETSFKNNSESVTGLFHLLNILKYKFIDDRLDYNRDKFMSNELILSDEIFKLAASNSLVKMNSKRNQLFSLPPNWNAILALRGLTILQKYPMNKYESNEADKNSNITAYGKSALNLFKNRFRMALRLAASLSTIRVGDQTIVKQMPEIKDENPSSVINIKLNSTGRIEILEDIDTSSIVGASPAKRKRYTQA